LKQLQLIQILRIKARACANAAFAAANAGRVNRAGAHGQWCKSGIRQPGYAFRFGETAGRGGLRFTAR